MSELRGARIGVLEARRAAELAELVRRRGGVPVSAAALAEARADVGDEVAKLLSVLAGEPAPLFVFLTGVGVSAVLAEADKLGRGAELRALLARALLACRGPKPVAALAREGLRAAVTAGEPYTEAELLASLTPLNVFGRPVVVVHHGERSAGLCEALVARGARLWEVTPYAWRLPADVGPLRALVEELAAGELAAVLFTSQIQARHLLAIAGEMGRADEVRAALREGTVVASIGPTCSRVLASLGIRAEVEPERPKMGPLISALAARLAAGRGGSGAEAGR